jgi:peptidoglycan/LPS O-acetylase OafA/YrhL
MAAPISQKDEKMYRILNVKSGPERSEISEYNNMDLLRFIFAASVMMVHMSRLTAESSLSFLELIFDSGIAVDCFFIISGFLIVRSYEMSSKLTSYSNKRWRRIYPAYFSVIILMSIFGLFITTLNASEYFSQDLLKYIASNLIFANFLHPDLPGVFTSNPLNNAVNGALWTIKIEVSFYLIVPIIVWMIRRFGALPVILGIYILSIIYRLGLEHLGKETLSKQLPGQMTYFMSGALIYYFFKEFQKVKLYLFIPAIALFFIFRTGEAAAIIQPIALGITVLTITFTGYFGNFGRYGDFSYGLYVWHYPVIQTLIFLGVFSNPYVGMFSTIGITLILAVMSWYAIEKPFLRKSSHYRKVET